MHNMHMIKTEIHPMNCMLPDHTVQYTM